VTSEPHRPGCFRVALSGVVLVLLAPVVATLRGWQRWRRGRAPKVGWERSRLESPAGELARLDLVVDVPAAEETAWRRRVVDTVVRLAEALRRDDDVYHLLYREPAEPETVAVPVGPRVQELGERMALVLGRRSLERRTAVWLTLSGERSLGAVMDPFAYDPEASGEPERLIVSTQPRWAAASSWARSPAAVRTRVLLYVPASSATVAEELLGRLRR
jgi:hypothetical protein